jgi:hypothetical protein
MLAFPRMTAPALRSLVTTPASRGTTEPSRLYEPAVVFIPADPRTSASYPSSRSYLLTFTRDRRNVVLEQDWNPMQRPSGAEHCAFLVQYLRLEQR